MNKALLTSFLRRVLTAMITIVTISATAQTQARTVNPILPGFNPDPSICRVGDDYYICTSSFTWYPGLPIYHSRDLINWELVGHAINRPGMVNLDGVKDKDGVWAPTLRHHEGRWYIFCNVSNRGNFFITATDIRGPWSDPVFIKGMDGIDPSVFWDDDGRAYVMANTTRFPNRKYQASTAIYMQQIDLTDGTLTGERHILTSGHALNARYGEAPHLYKIDGRYVLVIAEGGTNFNHAVTVMTSNSLFGPYLPQQVNPVLTQRHYGHNSPLQCVGHADLVMTPAGKWYAVALGKRMVGGRHAFTRETFLCPVAIEGGEFIFNPGQGGMTMDIPRPELPECPVAVVPSHDGFDGTELPPHWYFERIPHTPFHRIGDGRLTLSLRPETLDSLVSPAMTFRRVLSHDYLATTAMTFAPRRKGEAAGLVLHRNASAYVALLRTTDGIAVIESGRTTAVLPYDGREVCLSLTAHGMTATLEFGPTPDNMTRAAEVSLTGLADDGRLNRFNGLGVGVYATSDGRKSRNEASFSHFAYEDIASAEAFPRQ